MNADRAWTDADRDGCDTRIEVLRRDSSTTVTNSTGCDVVNGASWAGRYDNIPIISLADATVDHVVALKETWDSGAWLWSGSQRIAYANDLSDSRTLRVVTRSMNASKGDRDPSNWVPTAGVERCRFIGDWVAIKARWQLSMDQSEFGRIRNLLLGECAGLQFDPWRPTAVNAVTASTTTPAAVARRLVDTSATTSTTAPYYANCTEARAAGAAPLRRGEPGYRPALDANNDGVACT